MNTEQVLDRLLDLKTKTGDSEYLLVCPFHDDHKPSLSLNTLKLVFKCHACGASGDHEKLIGKVTGLPTRVIKYELAFYEGVTDFPQVDVRQCHKNLMCNEKALDFLLTERRWSLEIINKYQLGLQDGRIQIPIYSAFGDLLNVRSYRPRATEGKMLNISGYGRARVFPISIFIFAESTSQATIPVDYFTFVEGEPDCLAGLSSGLTCVTSTSGASSVPHGTHLLFEKAKVVVCYDADDAGYRGADKLAQALHGASVGVANLRPILGENGKDLTDYLSQGGEVDLLLAHLTETPFHTRTSASAPAPVQSKIDVSEPPVETTLQESSQESFYHKMVKIQVMVSGKTLAPYLVPRKVQVKCPTPGLRMCDGCGLSVTAGCGDLLFDQANPLTLELIETHTESHTRVFRKCLGIPSKCGIFTVDVLEAQNIEEAKVIPVLEHTSGEAEYVMRQIYFMGHGLRPNNTYEMICLTMPHPKTQQVTYLVNSAIAMEDSISKFKVTDELIAQLRIFSVSDDKDREKIG